MDQLRHFIKTDRKSHNLTLGFGPSVTQPQQQKPMSSYSIMPVGKPMQTTIIQPTITPMKNTNPIGLPVGTTPLTKPNMITGFATQNTTRPNMISTDTSLFNHNSGIQSDSVRRGLAILPPALVFKDIRESGSKGLQTLGQTASLILPPKNVFNPSPAEAQQRREQFFGWMKPSGSTYNNTRYDSAKTMAVEVGTGRIASQNPGMNTGNTKLEDHYFIQNKGGAWKDMGIYNDSLRK